ncbi:hypothetical protein [Dactylosporangium cerinum]
MHPAEDEQHQAELPGEGLHRRAAVRQRLADLQCHRDIAEVEQVEADDEEMVDGLGEAFVGERVVEEHLPVLEQRPRHPDGEDDAHRQVDQIRAELEVHDRRPS